MKNAVFLSLAILALSLSWATYWTVVEMRETADLAKKTINQGTRLFASLYSITLDVRANLTHNAQVQAKILDAHIGAVNRATMALERTCGAVDTDMAILTERVSTGVSVALRGVARMAETAADEIGNISRETRQTLAGIGAVTDATVASLRDITDSTCAAVDETGDTIRTTDALVGELGGVAESAHRLADYYEKKLTAPLTKWQKIKNALGLVAWAATVTMPFWWRPNWTIQR